MNSGPHGAHLSAPRYLARSVAVTATAIGVGLLIVATVGSIVRADTACPSPIYFRYVLRTADTTVGELCLAENLRVGHGYQPGPTSKTFELVDCALVTSEGGEVVQRFDNLCDVTRYPLDTIAYAYPIPARTYCLAAPQPASPFLYANRLKPNVIAVPRLFRRWGVGGHDRHEPDVGPVIGRPRCEYVCVYQRVEREPLTQGRDRDGAFVIVTRCCGQETVLCDQHLLAAQDCEWAECLSCTQLFTPWQCAAAAFHRIN